MAESSDDDHDEVLAYIQRIYERATLSGSPRAEVFAATVVCGVAAGSLYSAVDHAYRLSGDLLWLCVLFFGSLVYQLREPALCFSALLAGLLFRLTYRFGHPFRLVVFSSRREKFLKSLVMAVTEVGCVVLIAWITVRAIERVYPTLHVDHARYNAGG